MIEFIILVSVVFFLVVGYQQLYPVVRKLLNYRKERNELVVRYNRLWRSRRDMLVSYTPFLTLRARFILIGQ